MIPKLFQSFQFPSHIQSTLSKYQLYYRNFYQINFKILIKFSIFFLFLKPIKRVLATVVTSNGKATLTPIQGICVWFTLFILSATLASAESAITKISPWRVSV
jgi:hypothetical protein